jgi:multifunctional 2-oxoglutarate metabolism enzyme
VSTTSSQTIPVVLPELGESVTEGIVVEWRVAEGDVVEPGQPLLDVTTDKVDVEVPAPAAGRIARIVAAPGDTVEVGALLAELWTGGAGDGDGGEANGSRAAAPASAPAGDGAGGRVPIVLPDMESVTEGTVVEWRVAVGDAVAAEQVVVEVSTDKVDLEVPAPAAGILASIAVAAGPR